MQDVTLNITLKLQGPILTHSTAPGASQLSSPFARNSRGRYYIPGSLVKGRLREAWTELESAAGQFLQTRCGLTMKQLLGSGSGNQQNYSTSIEPRRGRLHFEHFVDHSKGAATFSQGPVRYRIKLDEARGSVSKGAYQVIEAPYATGEEASFVGQIHFRARDASDVEKIKDCIQIGLRWITNLGANCNVGFGRLLDAQVTDVQQSTDVQPATVTATGAEKLELEITPQAPFCVSRRRVADNLFESEIIIPGAVLKGSVAHTWRTLLGDDPDGEISAGYDPTRPELCEHFHLIRFTHAFPSQAGQQSRPVTAPLSLVKAHEELLDVALFDKPILIGKQNGLNRNEWLAPAFAIDWKDDTDVRESFGWANPKREMRVRTAIDATLRKAKDEQLFAYEMIVPEDLVWHSSVDLSAITDSELRQRVEEQLLGILAHQRDGQRDAYALRGLGKTKTQANVSIQAAGSTPPKCVSNRTPQINSQTQEQFWIVTLQTPAILCDSQEVNSGGLSRAYQQAWDELSSSTIQLKHFFAQQSLSGGYYLYRRFMKPDEYYPYLLTDPGSVFVLAAVQGNESEAQACIDDWFEHGLPLPEFSLPRGRHDDLPPNDWRNCPYLREGGYGEIAVNLGVHTELSPQPQEVKQL
jgi:CRISPR/Cas system CSM-associated protein Csm3 (group 7 of RAMP superfamily)